jgi:uncharacterized membrane protein YhhN
VIAATIVCVVCVVALVYGEYADNNRVRFLAKPLASAAFVAVALLARAGGEYAPWICIGLVLGAIGDVALLWERGFLAGLVAFLCGHAAYCVAFAQLVPPRAWLGEAGLYAIAPAIVAALALAWMWLRLGTMRGPVIVYVAVIVTMVIAALAAARTPGAPDGPNGPVWEALPAHTARLVALGACLFFASDLAVARDKFVARSFVNRAWGLPAYYAAQLLLAWSLAA